MTGAAAEIRIVAPDQPEVSALLELHLRAAHSATSAELVFALDRAGLARPGITLFGVYSGNELKAIGALKDLGDGDWEVKSMRAAPAARGLGFGRVILEHLIAQAKGRGGKRLLLETGATPEYIPATRLYESAGFTETGPFGDYPVSDFNRYYVLAL